MDAAPPALLHAAAEVQRIAAWVQRGADNSGLPYLILDKKGARLFVFSPQGKALANSPVLLGSTVGDESVPGIGDKPFSEVLATERTTPAGRFITQPGRNLEGEEIIWLDYAAAVSIHRVRANVPAERRLERLASPSPADNRISFGCINVPVGFYQQYLLPVFARGRGVAYVIPEVMPLKLALPGLTDSR